MFIIFLISTLYYASLGHLTQTNFTGIANELGYFVPFLLWTLFAAFYFFTQSYDVFKNYHFTHKYLNLQSFIILVCFLITPFIPYNLNNIHLSDLHVFTAMTSTILFIVLWLRFIWHLYLFYPTLFQKIQVPFFLFIQSLALIFLLFGRVNTIVELWIIFAITGLIEYLKNHSKKVFKKI